MGSTGYFGVSMAEAKKRELEGCTIVHQSGNWYIARNHVNALFALYMITHSYADEKIIKCVETCMGPYEVPPEPFFRRWLKESAADPNCLINDSELEWRAKCERVYAANKAAERIVAGTRFTLNQHLCYPSPIGDVDAFTMVDPKRRIATAPNGMNVRLPRGWQSMLETPVTATLVIRPPAPVGSAP